MEIWRQIWNRTGKRSSKMVFSFYSHAFLAAPIFWAKFFSNLGFSNPSNRSCRIHQDIDGHHDPLIYCPVLLLLAHSPSSGSTCQTLAVSTHKPPQSVYETLYDLFQAFFEEVLSHFLGVLKGFFLHFTIMVLAPTPVLTPFSACIITFGTQSMYHLNGI